MGDFNAAVGDDVFAKGCLLYANFPYVHDLHRFRLRSSAGKSAASVSTTEVELRSGGSKAITGNTESVRSTQVYPEGYGRAASLAYNLRERELKAEASARQRAPLSSPLALSLLLKHLQEPRDVHEEWSHARLDSVFAFLAYFAGTINHESFC